MPFSQKDVFRTTISIIIIIITISLQSSDSSILLHKHWSYSGTQLNMNEQVSYSMPMSMFRCKSIWSLWPGLHLCMFCERVCVHWYLWENALAPAGCLLTDAAALQDSGMEGLCGNCGDFCKQANGYRALPLLQLTSFPAKALCTTKSQSPVWLTFFRLFSL